MAKGKKSPSASLHPPYFEMIADAISTLKERTGSSHQAIAKFIEDKHKKVLPPNFRKMLSLQLKNFVKSERLYKVKNSYKISSKDHETQKSKTASKATKKTTPPPKQKGGKKIAEKTKKLSQVKTPEALKKKTSTTTNTNKDATKKKTVATSGGKKVKRLSQVKTPEAVKKKPNLTPMKRKSTPKPINSSRPTKKARK
ncbi:histone H1-like [Gastrolobium bilobum]|uniref:histone H1-like n=1 Tax=Gastrolobium bilobum TaxID=150636 RepID=UPI002AAFC09D|nr:histone H1-like [Gastrolobium bilobum]